MWGRKPDKSTDASGEAGAPGRLKDAMREARIEAAERTSVVVDLRDAEVARLEILNEALDPLFAEIPSDIDMFDRAISRGDTPRLWIDMVAHVVMGRDKRVYRFVQDTRFGRRIHAESHETGDIVAAITRYAARRLVERERALAEGPAAEADVARGDARPTGGQRGWQMAQSAAFGLILGLAAIAAAIWLFALRP
jgi:hypothetical protein